MISPAASWAATTPWSASEEVVRNSRSASRSSGSTEISGEVEPLEICSTPDGIDTEVAVATVTPLDQPPMIAATPSASTSLRADSMAGVGRVLVSSAMCWAMMGPPKTCFAAALIWSTASRAPSR